MQDNAVTRHSSAGSGTTTAWSALRLVFCQFRMTLSALLLGHFTAFRVKNVN